MISYWEQQSFMRYDVIIVGAGISGLSTAASVKEKMPGLEVLVIERGTLPTGASTKNAGFACFGSVSELAQDRKLLGDEGMVALVKRRWEGLQKTIGRLGNEKIGLLTKGGYELLNTENAFYLDQVEEVNTLLGPIFKDPVFTSQDQNIKKFGFNDTIHLIYNRYEGQLHTGKLIKSLWNYCSALGIQIITGTEVKDVLPDGKEVLVVTDKITFSSAATGVCTNAFTSSILPDRSLDIRPGRGMVMLIQPEKPLPFEGTFHYDEGYYYFRDIDGKMIFGGGRNLALDEEETTDFGINKKIEKKLHSDLNEKILPGFRYTTEMVWSGIMAFGADKTPILKEADPGVFLGVRLGGMGVAIGSLVGEELAALILEKRFSLA